MNYIDNCKCIIVDRDPRDIYLLNENVNKASFIPSNNINKFIKWYRDFKKWLLDNIMKTIMFLGLNLKT